MVKCQYCGLTHDFTCPRIKSIEYDGPQIRRIEFHENWNAAAHSMGLRNPFARVNVTADGRVDWMG
jgi:hypothetical protein